jgi:hypothetical protein
MQGTTRCQGAQAWLGVLSTLAGISFLGLALLGQVPVEVAGWQEAVAVAPVWVWVGRARPTAAGCGWAHWRVLQDYLLHSWPPVLLRSLAVWGLWAVSGGWGPAWLRLAPWVLS